MRQRAALGKLSIFVLLVVGATACAAGESDPGATAPTPNTLALDVQPEPFAVKCAGIPLTMYGVPGPEDSSPAFVTDTSRIVTPIGFHISTTVKDPTGAVVFRRTDDRPRSKTTDPDVQTCSFDVYTTDRHGFTYIARGSADANFTT